MNTASHHSPRSDSILRAARHVLFVEGASEGSFDREMLSTLLEDRIEVRALGPSRHVRAAAEALATEHPTYYFLIDQDCYDDAFVERCWANFPDAEKSNLLIWRKRELENYFLDPEFLGRCRFLREGKDLNACVVKHARKYVLLDAVSYVIEEVRETLKETWIAIPRDPDQFRSRGDAIGFLHGCPEFDDKRNQVGERTSPKWLEDRFNTICDEMTGGQEPIVFGAGTWLSRISGKQVFSSVVSECFDAKDAQGNTLTGKDAQIAIGKDLITQDANSLPDDFRELKRLILKRVGVGT